MEVLKTILTVGILPVAVAFITTKITYRKETQKAILEKRAPLYLDVQRRAESLMYNSNQIFDIKFRNSILKYKPQIELLASKNVKTAYLEFYKFIADRYDNYLSFCNQNDPRNDSKNFYIEYDEDGDEVEMPLFHDEDIEYFESQEKKYKEENCPTADKLKTYIDRLYEAMRKDLGSDKK